MSALRPRKGKSSVDLGGGGGAAMAALVEGCSPVIVVEPNAARARCPARGWYPRDRPEHYRRSHG
jgi:hypothetical protein